MRLERRFWQTGAALVATAVAALIAIGCGSGNGNGDAVPAAPAPSPEVADQARAIYDDQSCALCHGDNAEGNENGPALRKLAPYWTVERLVTYLEDPDAFKTAHRDFDARRRETFEMVMPAYGHVSVEERTVLARWLMTR